MEKGQRMEQLAVNRFVRREYISEGSLRKERMLKKPRQGMARHFTLRPRS